ncbi:MAG: cyclohexanone monooxygenase, partial [Nocardioidaceae bacterium]
FHITDMPVAGLLRDEDGRSLDQHWRGSPRSYLGTVTHGFPNLFTLLGPNLGTGHSSAFTILESQLELVVGAVTRALDEGWSAIDVRPEVQERYNHLVQEALAGTVYNAGGCSSYYLDANGRNSFSWPWSTGRLREMVGAFDPDDFAVQAVKVAQR